MYHRLVFLLGAVTALLTSTPPLASNSGRACIEATKWSEFVTTDGFTIYDLTPLFSTRTKRIPQVSREGFQSIDEYLENHRNVDRHEWVTQPQYENMKDYELMTNRVEWAYPTQTREFVALDIIDRPRKILISKSALHPERPGGSRYQTDVPLDETEFVRAVQYYASKVEPLPNGECLLRMVTWGEMCDSYTAFWINKFNAHVFITPKYKRFRRVMEDGEEVFELSNIVNEAWKLPKLLMIKPDHSVAKGSNFVDNLRNQGIEVCV